MVKIVYSACYGGFGLSEAAIVRYGELKGIPLYKWSDPKFKDSDMFGVFWFTEKPDPQWRQVPNEFFNQYYFEASALERNDPILVQVVEELGSEKASGRFAKLVIAELPKGTMYRIDEYDGLETVETNDSYEWRVA